MSGSPAIGRRVAALGAWAALVVGLIAPWMIADGAPVSQHGLLWRIDGAGPRPSYLFGTIHSDDPRVTRLPPPVRRALDGAESFVMEVILDKQAKAELADAVKLPAGQTLPELIGDDWYARTVAAMAKHGYPASAVARLKPWVVIMTLSTPPAHGGEVLDLVLYHRAKALGKPVYGLETVDEQVDLLDDMAQQDQVTALQDTLTHLGDLKRISAELRAAYLARDLGRLLQISEQSQSFGDRQVTAELMHRLLDERNDRMVTRMLPRLLDGGAFIAVGALHLPGKDGLLAQLRGLGYQLTALY